MLTTSVTTRATTPARCVRSVNASRRHRSRSSSSSSSSSSASRWMRATRRREGSSSVTSSSAMKNDEDAEPLNEASLADVMAKLKAAEEEREKLRAELEAKTPTTDGGEVKTVDELARMKPKKSAARIDGVGQREILFGGSRKEGDAWLRDGMEFLVRDQPSEAGMTVEGMTEEEKGTVNRRLIVGLALTAAFAGLSQIEIEAPEPSKPLFFYLVPIVRSRELLRRATKLAEEGEWEELNSTVNAVTGPPNDVKENLFKAAAYLSGSREQKAREIAFDFLEYMEKVNYSKYFENMGTAGGAKAAEYAKFSAKASKSAIGKIDEFLALMDREAVDAAESQVMAFSSPQFIAASSEGEPESDVAETMAANDDEMTSV